MTQNRTDLGKVVGANLRRLIKGSAYRTQAEFAYAFGVDERTVRRWVSSGVEKVYKHYFANKGPFSQSYGFSSGHVWM